MVSASKAITITPPNRRMYSAAPWPEFSLMNKFVFFIVSPNYTIEFFSILILLYYKKVLLIIFFSIFIPFFPLDLLMVL